MSKITLYQQLLSTKKCIVMYIIAYIRHIYFSKSKYLISIYIYILIKQLLLLLMLHVAATHICKCNYIHDECFMEVLFYCRNDSGDVEKLYCFKLPVML